MLDGLGFGEADTVIADAEGMIFLIGFDAYLQLVIAGHEAGVGQGFKAQLIAGVGGIAHQFAQEDLTLGIEAMDHQL